MAIGIINELMIFFRAIVEHYHSDIGPTLGKTRGNSLEGELYVSEVYNTHKNTLWSRVRAIFWVIALLVIGFVCYQNLIPSGTLILTQDFKKIKPGISDLGPSTRVVYKSGQRVLTIEPVYMKINTLYSFNTVKLILSRVDTSSQPLSIGVRTSTLWNYEWQTYKDGGVTFPWNPYFDTHTIEVALSSPGLESAPKKIILSNIRVELSRQALTSDTFKHYVAKILSAIFHS